MPIANTFPITLTRRRALRSGFAVLATGSTSSAHASAQQATSSDTTMVDLCDRLIALQRQLASSMLPGQTLAEEEQAASALNGLYDAQAEIFARLTGLPPVVTFTGMQALARASLAMAPRTPEGTIIYADGPEWLTFTALEALISCTAA